MADTIKVSNNQDAVYVEVDAIPAGWTSDDIFYTTSAGKYYKIANDGNIRALKAKVLANGTDQTSRINTVLANAKVQELIFDAYNQSITISGTVTVPTGKTLVFKNNCKLIGSGTLAGAFLVDCDVNRQCFGTGLTVTDCILNQEISVKWFGAVPDLLANISNIGTATDNLSPFNKAIHSGKSIISSADYNVKRNIYIPGDANYYYLSGQLVIDTRITMRGDGSGLSTLHFPSAMGIPAVKLKYTITGSLLYGFNIQLKHLTIDGGNSTRYATGLDTTSIGIEINTPFCQFEDVEVFGFRYAGWHFYGCAGGSPPMIADYATMLNCKGNYNGVGLMFEDCDAQVINVIGGQYSYNARINIWSKDTLGNNFLGVGNESSAFQNPNQKSMVTYGGDWYRALNDNINSTPGGGNPDWELAGAGGGVTPYIFAWNSGTNYVTGNIGYFVDGASDKSHFMGCYAEGDQRKLYNLGQATGFGGYMAENGEEPGMIGMLQGILTGRNFQSKNPDTAISSVLLGETNYTIGWKDDNISKLFGFKYLPSDKAFAIAENGTLGNFGIYSSSSVLTGRATIPNGGLVATNDGITFYNGTDAYNIIGVAKAAPTAGQHYVGDIYLNVNPATVGATRGWLCTTAGNPGTFTTLSAGGGGGGSLTQYHVGVGDASNLLSGSSNFTYNGNTLKIASAAAAYSIINFANTGDANGLIEYNGTDFNFYTANTLRAILNSTGLTLQAGESLGVGIAANTTYPLYVYKASGDSLARFQNGNGSLAIGFDPSGAYFQPFTLGMFFYSPSGLKVLIVDDNGTRITGDLKIGASGYLNWGATFGSSGYGIRDNGGTMEVKNSGGSWAAIPASAAAQVDTLNVQYTDAANSGTSETDLMSYSVGAGQLATDGDRLEVLATFEYAANANSKTLKFKFGAYVATWSPSEVTSSGSTVKVTATIIRTSATTQKIVWEFKPQYGTHSVANSTASETLSGAVTLKFTGQSGTASNDITQKTMTVTYYPI